MASAKTHFSASTIISGFAAASLLAANLAKPTGALVCLLAAIAGGGLPDLDADNSRPLKLTFHAIAICAAFAVVFLKAESYSAAELAAVWLFIYLAVRIGAVKLFEKATVHRGLFHSIPAGALAALLTANLCSRVFKFDDVQSLTIATFMLGGYLLHLLLDELAALNLFGIGPKKSLGTALKLYSKKNLKGTVALYLTATLLLLSGPNWQNFSSIAFNASTYQKLNDFMLPQAQWFEDLRAPLRSEALPAQQIGAK